MKSLTEKYIVDEKGRKKAVVISINEYRELLENLHDLAVVAERHDEPAVSLKEVGEELRRDDLFDSEWKRRPDF